ncbi:MAG: hypothetical protein HYT35_01320, partial [Candidatus Staskawiczbacteria bacterium]|nr:hypothetical protein [Candidatus Staskawiczbacteria bacterium]
MNKFKFERWIYKSFFRPILFIIDSEKVHNQMTRLGELMENSGGFLDILYSYKKESLAKSLLGISFDNPVGLAAGF